MNRYFFSFRSAYDGETDYMVYDRNTREEHRIRLKDGKIRSLAMTVDAELLDAFNTWRRNRHKEQITYMREHPERFDPQFINDQPPQEATA